MKHSKKAKTNEVGSMQNQKSATGTKECAEKNENYKIKRSDNLSFENICARKSQIKNLFVSQGFKNLIIADDRFSVFLKLEGDKTEISKLKQKLEGPFQTYGETALVDFDKIIPMPYELKLGTNPSKELIGKRIDWCYQNWGCKCNAGYSEYIGFNKIRFETINGACLVVMLKLSERFSEIKVHYFVEYDEEDYFCTIMNGKILKSNYEFGDKFDYEIDYISDDEIAEIYSYERGDELRYMPGSDPDEEPNDDPYEEPDYDPYEISDYNEEIEKIINRVL